MKPILDLDILVPEAKPLKLNGKIVMCNSPTLNDLVALARLQEYMDGMKTVDDMENMLPKVKEVLSRMMPEIADDPDFKITAFQLGNLIKYLEKATFEQAEVSKDTDKEFSPKKKLASPTE